RVPARAPLARAPRERTVVVYRAFGGAFDRAARVRALRDGADLAARAARAARRGVAADHAARGADGREPRRRRRLAAARTQLRCARRLYARAPCVRGSVAAR